MDGLEVKAKQIPMAREIVELRRRLSRSEKEKAETLQAQDRASADKKNSQQALDELVASFDAEANKTAAEEINGKLAKISYAKTDAELLKGLSLIHISSRASRLSVSLPIFFRSWGISPPSWSTNAYSKCSGMICIF